MSNSVSGPGSFSDYPLPSHFFLSHLNDPWGVQQDSCIKLTDKSKTASMSKGPTIHLWVGTVYLAHNRCSVNKTYDITHFPFSHNNLEGYSSSFSFSSWRNKTWEEKLLPNDTQQRGDSISPEFCFRAPGFATTVRHTSYWSVGLACLGQVHSSRTEQGRQK